MEPVNFIRSDSDPVNLNCYLNCCPNSNNTQKLIILLAVQNYSDRLLHAWEFKYSSRYTEYIASWHSLAYPARVTY